jgi:hypothetical protein
VAKDFETRDYGVKARVGPRLAHVAAAPSPHRPKMDSAEAVNPSTGCVDNFVGNWWRNAAGSRKTWAGNTLLKV